MLRVFDLLAPTLPGTVVTVPQEPPHDTNPPPDPGTLFPFGPYDNPPPGGPGSEPPMPDLYPYNPAAHPPPVIPDLAAIGSLAAAQAQLDQLPSGEELFRQILQQPSKALPPPSPFEEFLAKPQLSDFQRILQRPFAPGDPLAVVSAEEAAGIPLAEVASGILGGLALGLVPSGIAPSDFPTALEAEKARRGGAALGPAVFGPTGPMLDTTVTSSPLTDTGAGPNPFADLKPETAHPPAPLPFVEPAFNPSLIQPSLLSPQGQPNIQPLTRFERAVGPFNPFFPGTEPRTGPKGQPKPSQRAKAQPLGPTQTIKSDCNKAKAPGKCRQGYFREKESGDLQLITWSTRKCPSSSPMSRLRRVP